MNRKQFFHAGAGSLAGIVLAPGLIAAHPGQSVPSIAPNSPVGSNSLSPNGPDPLPMDMVKEFVIAGHKDLPKVQSMLKDHSNLLYCKYDWGNGDFEAGIEGAGHMGNKAIAQYLIDSGSRVTLFVLTMLGRTDLVKPILEAYPKMIFGIGPHGFTLLHHAKVGGKEGEALAAYLQEKGLTEDWVQIK